MRLLTLLTCCFLLMSCARTVADAPQQPINPPPTAVSSPPATIPATAVPSPTPLPTVSPTPPPSPSPSPSPTPTPAYPVYSGDPLAREAIGVQIHLHREDLADLMTHLETLGVGWVKVQVSWKLYQPAPDRFDDGRFAELDALVAAAAARDIAVLLGVAKAPEWSRPTTEFDGPPTDFSLYQTFMEYLARRYQGRVAAYELWNEANLQREWFGAPLNAADFVALMRAGAAGVRAADATAVLISGAPATTGINDGVVAIDDRLFLQQMLAAGVGDFVDAVGVHPYGWANPPDSRMTDGETAVPSHNNHPSFFFRDTLTDYATLLTGAGIAKPLWVTEFGWGSFDGFLDESGAPATPPPGAEFMAYVSEWQQATYILRAFELAQTWEFVGPMMLWNLNFGPLLGPEFAEAGYSLLDRDNRQRPAYLALQHALNR